MLLAELDGIAASEAAAPKVKQVKAEAPERTQKQEACKFFQGNGCKWGKTCSNRHVFQSWQEQKSRCYVCGSKNHKLAECSRPKQGKNHATLTAGGGAGSADGSGKSSFKGQGKEDADLGAGKRPRVLKWRLLRLASNRRC